MSKYTVFEICAGAGGQALGLEQADFEHVGAIEIDADACATLTSNRSCWHIEQSDIREFNGKKIKAVDLFAGGVPCPSFSVAGKQLGQQDERDLFPIALHLIKESQPKSVMLENVRGLATSQFDAYRNKIVQYLKEVEYEVFWKILNASDFGVPQLRPRFILVGMKKEYAPFFQWPTPYEKMFTVADAIGDLMRSRGWKGAASWLEKAKRIAPTLVGGSKKHGGADLGPTRAKQKWLELGIDGMGISNEPPSEQFPENGCPRLTLEMVARLQAFPDDWIFIGSKTSKYRQIGNAFPPPVARSVGSAIHDALAKQKPNEQSIQIGNQAHSGIKGGCQSARRSRMRGWFWR